jgi:hypothetical protein
MTGGTGAMTEKGGESRRCPWCGGTEVAAVQRGFAGKTDGNDQYFRCRSCGKTTWEMVSKTAQEVRIGRYQVGKSFTERGDRYLIRRVLKVGFNEYLLYLKPAPLPEQEPVGETPKGRAASDES